MTTPSFYQLLVEPSQIEAKLKGIWEELSKKNKTRASIFNLIVVNRLSERTDYFRGIVQKVVEKFPCRILFISEDPTSKTPYLKTAISVLFPKDDPGVACDLIDIGAAGKDLEKVPFLVLPHLLPDLPIYLLWAEDPSQSHPLFTPLLKLASRAIFDSEASDDLLAFSNRLLSIKKEFRIDIADLNWARMQGWRNLISSTMDPKERLESLLAPSQLKITYNERKTQFFCHLKIQAVYLLGWLASRLKWGKIDFERKILSQTREDLAPGSITSFEFQSKMGFLFDAKKDPSNPNSVRIEISTKEKCELPYQFVLAQTALGHSLVQEICMKGTSRHFLEVLETLKNLNIDDLC